ncbi:MAG: BglII/BstYI family type II restriction endonuclease, partial [Alphaproteobacteria bacterium]|nr:BglII/BstYI family type II restriction endonuclease [Alphaproteobacteria bacterium]
FNGGKQMVLNEYSAELDEITQAIYTINAEQFKTKISKEKTMLNRILYSPVELNNEFKRQLYPHGWVSHKVNCDYVHGEILPGYIPAKPSHVKPFRDMDFVKPGKKLGVEVQFGKYAFMVYNVCAKMTIFSNLGLIDTGIEIVPVKNFADEMSTGVSYFEQFAWDLNQRGVSNIDTPVLILGIDA